MSLWPRVFVSYRKERGVVMVKGQVTRWDGTVNVMVSDMKTVPFGRPDTGVPWLALTNLSESGQPGRRPARERIDRQALGRARGWLNSVNVCLGRTTTNPTPPIPTFRTMVSPVTSIRPCPLSPSLASPR